jgi:hypothetical protein
VADLEAGVAHYWEAADGTFNKLKKYATVNDAIDVANSTAFAILVKPVTDAADAIITLVKIDDRGTTTYTINYSGVTFTP